MKILCVGAATLLLIACDRERATGPTLTETKKGSVAKAEMLRAEIKMGAGELTVEGGGKEEVSAEFHYSSGGPMPEFRLDTTTFRARLNVEDGKTEGASMDLKENRWKVQLADLVPTDLSVNLGAGEARLNLGMVDLRSVALNIGAGKVVADFVGAPRHDYEVKLRGGVGECDITLPKGVGIHAEATGGMGSIDVKGLDKKGDAYENDLFLKDGPKIRISAQGGLGAIKISTR